MIARKPSLPTLPPLTGLGVLSMGTYRAYYVPTSCDFITLSYGLIFMYLYPIRLYLQQTINSKNRKLGFIRCHIVPPSI